MSVVTTTEDIFDGRDRVKVWDKECLSWNVMTKSHDYLFPGLESSPYAKSLTTEVQNNRPVICQGMRWSMDGISLTTVNDDFGVRQYLIPEGQKQLVPFQRFFKTHSIISHAIHPNHSLFEKDDNNKVILLSSNDLPIQLYSLNPMREQNKSLVNFRFVNEENDKLLTAYSIDFCSRKHFILGSTRNTIALFDVSRREPLWSSQSTRIRCGRHAHKTIVSCFDQCNERHDNIRYAGTYKSEFLRVDPRACHISTWKTLKDGNRGIYQILQSDNGHYFYIFKRNSDKITILDLRKSMEVVNELQLPFKVYQQKFYAAYSPYHGLLMGDDSGHLLRWTTDIIEFGGIDRYGRPSSDGIRPTDVIDLNTGPVRINIVHQNPSDINSLSVSYSPDKFCELNDKCKSGIMLIKL
ncbi:Swt21p Ecym_6429 [Eremothecium cymbalariae DBVPG|uniref:Protein SWT21 n=1 Tax=Eremothecium cymbalariae (strain CBS 270.75 / DBVPG 7215 / KCTC 17166 / NRRL Y-17582) TaxID=931890 RepID=G8JUM0_ERECY|nr:hypothetical protein Ecym_6429 [Eremothecium cymbalariae DBVPG\